jgi:hypothetical protein
MHKDPPSPTVNHLDSPGHARIPQPNEKRAVWFDRPFQDCSLTTCLNYRPAAAEAAFGVMPAIFMDSIRFSTDSKLEPVSVQAST